MNQKLFDQILASGQPELIPPRPMTAKVGSSSGLNSFKADGISKRLKLLESNLVEHSARFRSYATVTGSKIFKKNSAYEATFHVDNLASASKKTLRFGVCDKMHN